MNERLWRDVAGWTNGWAPFWSIVQCGYSGDHGVLEVADDWRTCCAWCATSTRMFMKGNFKKLDKVKGNRASRCVYSIDSIVFMAYDLGR